MDNNPVHTSRNSMKIFNELRCHVVFLSLYTQQLAPKDDVPCNEEKNLQNILKVK